MLKNNETAAYSWFSFTVRVNLLLFVTEIYCGIERICYANGQPVSEVFLIKVCLFVEGYDFICHRVYNVTAEMLLKMLQMLLN